MNTQLVNRLDAFRSVLTLKNSFASEIESKPILRSTFEQLASKLAEADPLLAQIAGRSDAHTVEKNSKRGDALEHGGRLGSALSVMAVRAKNEFLRARCADWRSVSSLRKGNREMVLGRLRALLAALQEHSRSLVPEHATEADINEFGTKVEAFSLSLLAKSQSVNEQQGQTSGFSQLISEISALVNQELTPTVLSLSEEMPDFVDAYKIARKVRSTAPASRSTANPERKAKNQANKELEMALKAKLALAPPTGPQPEPIQFKIAPSKAPNGVEDAMA